MSFYLFSVCSVFAVTVLMPINLKVCNRFLYKRVCLIPVKNNIGIGDEDNDWNKTFTDETTSPTPPTNPIPPPRDWLDLISDANSYLSVHLLLTYVFTILTLYFIHRNYGKFIRSRQLFSLELVHSISARTVMVTHLPLHLRGEHNLAEHFESMGMSVESVSVCREVDSLKPLLDKRTSALLKLESAWVNYVGNPSTVESYDPSAYATAPLIDVDSGIESQQARFVIPHRKRPTLRPGWFRRKVDAIEYWDIKFHEADEEVTKRRKNGKFKATHAAFVTFEKMSSAVRVFSFLQDEK